MSLISGLAVIVNLHIDRLGCGIIRDVHEVPGLVQVRLDWQVVMQTLLDVIWPRSRVNELAASFILLEDGIDPLPGLGTELIKGDGGNRLVATTVPSFGGGYQMPKA